MPTLYLGANSLHSHWQVHRRTDGSVLDLSSSSQFLSILLADCLSSTFHGSFFPAVAPYSTSSFSGISLVARRVLLFIRRVPLLQLQLLSPLLVPFSYSLLAYSSVILSSSIFSFTFSLITFYLSSIANLHPSFCLLFSEPERTPLGVSSYLTAPLPLVPVLVLLSCVSAQGVIFGEGASPGQTLTRL